MLRPPSQLSSIHQLFLVNRRPRAQPTWDEDYDWEEETFTPVTPAPADDEYDPLEMGAELPIKRSRI